jgi:hypothetical protein
MPTDIKRSARAPSRRAPFVFLDWMKHELLPARVDMSKHVDASYLPFPCSR